MSASRTSRAALLACVLSGLGLTLPSAGAADLSRDRPIADPVAGARLRAAADDVQRIVCLRLTAGRTSGNAFCSGAPRTVQDSFGTSLEATADRVAVDAFAVPSSVAHVELRYARGIVQSVATTLPYTDAPPAVRRMRFVIAARPGGARGRPAALAGYDATGTPLGVALVDHGRAGLPVPLLRRRGISVSASAGIATTPTPEDPAATAFQPCLGTHDAVHWSWLCEAPEPQLRPTLLGYTDVAFPSDRSADDARVLALLAAPAVARVDVALGDGTTRSLATRPVLDEIGARAVAATLPRDAAVRSVTAVAFDGRSLAVAALGLPPRAVSPGQHRLLDTADDQATGPLLPVAGLPSHVRVQRAGTAVCIVLGGAKRCGAPPVGRAVVMTMRDPVTHEGVVLSTPDIATLERVYWTRTGPAVPRRFPSVDVPAELGLGVRIAFLPARADMLESDDLDAFRADGRKLGRVLLEDPEAAENAPFPVDGPTRVAAVRGSARPLYYRSQIVSGAACATVDLEAGSPAERQCAFRGGGRRVEARVAVTCAPRRTVAFLVLPPTASRPRVLTDRGPIGPTLVLAPRPRGRTRLAVLVLPDADARLRAVQYEIAGRTRSLPTPAPPAREQCGYDYEAHEAFDARERLARRAGRAG